MCAMLQQVKSALQSSSSHGVSRMVTDKPLYVRIVWLLLYLLMVGLFFKGFVEFVVKLRSRAVSTSIDVDEVNFQFPDVYACLENPISASYSSNMNAGAKRWLETGLDTSNYTLHEELRRIFTGQSPSMLASQAPYYSILIPQSIPYNLVVDTLAHRINQTMIEASLVYKSATGIPVRKLLQPTSFYDVTFLRCAKVNISEALQANVLRSVSSSGIFLTILVDSTVPDGELWNSSVASPVYCNEARVPVSDWTMSFTELLSVDRRAGVRMFLTQPGEYPTDFVTSFSLAPGKYHTVEIDMTQQVHKANDFSDCVTDAPDVQFVNPYDQTPYSHKYSYSYCYYYEYHKQFQSIMNTSGHLSPLPWPLRGVTYLTNISNLHVLYENRPQEVLNRINSIDQAIQDFCYSKRPCSSLKYSASISSSGWPTSNSLPSFLASTVSYARQRAKGNNESVPALDFLATANASAVSSYMQKNMLKVLLKPARALCDRVTFSRDYGAQNFISDVGGIMGIYLGMSLLTLCEVFELIFDLLFFRMQRRRVESKAGISSAATTGTSAIQLD